jgi:hypothetical protein
MTTPIPTIAALRELLAKATPGEWLVESREAKHDHAINGYGWDELATVYGREVVDEEGDAEGRANAELIVAMRNALPALLDRLEAAEAVVKAAREYVPNHETYDSCPKIRIRLRDALAAYDRLGGEGEKL